MGGPKTLRKQVLCISRGYRDGHEGKLWYASLQQKGLGVSGLGSPQKPGKIPWAPVVVGY